MPTKKPLSPTVEVMSDGENTFVVADGSRIAKRGGPGTPQAKTWISLEPGWNVFDDDGMLVVDMTASLCIEGFRAWVTDDRARLEKCNCDFGGCENAEVNPHYRLSERYWPGPAPHDADVSSFPSFARFARFSRSGVDASHPNKKTAGSTDGPFVDSWG